MKLIKPQRVDATTGNLLHSIIIYTIPLILGTLTQTCFNAIDLAVLGNMADSNAVASVGATSMIIALLVNSFIGIAGGAKIILAHYFGAKNTEKLQKTASTSLIISLVLGYTKLGLQLLLIRRGGHPFLGCWALPGGFADEGETVEQTAARELEEETGLRGLDLKLVNVFSAPGRDPRGWTVSAAYAVCVDAGRLNAVAGDDAAEARWFDVDTSTDQAVVKLPDGERLAFDHGQIIEEAAKAMGL